MKFFLRKINKYNIIRRLRKELSKRTLNKKKRREKFFTVETSKEFFYLNFDAFWKQRARITRVFFSEPFQVENHLECKTF